MGNVFGRDEDHVRRDQGTTADVEQFDDARRQLTELRVPVFLHANDPHERLYVAALDGTGNSMRKDSSETWSVVAKVHDQLIRTDNPSIKSGYVEGIGTQDAGLPRFRDGIYANTFDERVETAYLQLCEQAQKWIREDPQARIRVAGVGFSRGAEEVAALNRMIEERGIRDPVNAVVKRDQYGLVTSVRYDHSRPALVPPRQTLQAAMLFDPVSTNNTEYDRRLAPSTVGGFQIRSDDRRNDFKGDRLLPDGFSEDNRFLSVHVPGPHSTAGDSYKTNGFGVLSANMGVAFLNSLSDRDFLKPQAVPQQAIKYQMLHSEDHLAFYSTSYYDRHHQRGYTDQLGADAQCRVAQPLPDCTHKAPVNPGLSNQVEYRAIRLPEQQSPPPMPGPAKSQAGSSDIFRSMSDAALRGDVVDMRTASASWLGTAAARDWLQEGRDLNERQRESELVAQLAQQQSQPSQQYAALAMQR